MTLWFDLNVNADTIGHVEITRTATRPDKRHAYRWRVNTGGVEYVGSIDHDETDGPMALAWRVLDAYLDATLVNS